MTAAEVQTEAIVNSNLDTAYLDGRILDAQRHYIRPFIGNDFYEELLTQIAASTLTVANTNIMVYIKRALAYYVVYEALPSIRGQVSKGGVMVNISSTSEPASDLTFGLIRNDYNSKAERYMKEIDFYIKDVRKDDSTAYPLYCKNQTQTSGIIIY